MRLEKNRGNSPLHVGQWIWTATKILHINSLRNLCVFLHIGLLREDFQGHKEQLRATIPWEAHWHINHL